MKKSMFGSLVMVMFAMVMMMGMSWNSWGQEITKNYRVDFKSTSTETLNFTGNIFRIDATIESETDLMNVINQSSDFSISLGQWGTEQIISEAKIVRITNKQGYAKCPFDGGIMTVKWNSSKIVITITYNSRIFGDNIVDLTGNDGYVAGITPLTIEVVTPGQTETISIKADAMYWGYAKMVGSYDFQRWNVMGNHLPFNP